MTASVPRLAAFSFGKCGWQLLYGFLAWRFSTPDWLFMNYGYADGAGEADDLALDPAEEPHRPFIRMYAHTLGPAGPVAGRDVLEVGCGRGGGSAWIARTQGARSVTGVDLSSRAIALCRRLHCAPNLAFRRGDAEKLPFPTASFDVVVNVESCHHYPSLSTFFNEVQRVLRPGGSFCVATYWDPPGLARFERALRDTSLELVRTADIAPRVMDSLRTTEVMKTTLIRRHAPRLLRPLLNHFTAVEGSRLYRGFMDGSIAYVSALLRKPPSVAPCRREALD